MPELANRPRKFKTAIAWLPDMAPEINDVTFVGAVNSEHGPGFDVPVGGGLSTKPFLGLLLDAWCRSRRCRRSG